MLTTFDFSISHALKRFFLCNLANSLLTLKNVSFTKHSLQRLERGGSKLKFTKRLKYLE